MRKLTRIAVGLAVAALAALSGTATATAAPPPTDASAQTLEWEFFTNTVAVGATRTYTAPAGEVYTVGLSPRGASTSQACEFEVIRTWYVQLTSGSRQFRFTIKNVGAIDCGTDVMLFSMADIAGAWNTNGVDPGASVTKHWNHAGTSSTYVAGAFPSGATSSAMCQFEVVREWYQQQPGGEKEFWFTLKNVGTIACSAEVLLGGQAAANASSTPILSPGGTASGSWFNNLDQRAYLVGFNPVSTATTACQFELTRAWHAQVINSDGTSQKQLHYRYRNAGAVTCGAVRLIATVA